MFNINNGRLTCLVLIMLVALFSANCLAAHNHTHIGINQDGISGTDDDNQLWFFSMPGTQGWPDWGYQIEMVPTGNYRADGKQDYICEVLYCWHSAHPADGTWQLPGSSDTSVLPEWQINLVRVSFDDDFFVLDGRDAVLTTDGSSVALNDVEWMEDKYNNNGELGSWGIHSHLYFHAWADGAGEVFSATFKTTDTGSTNLAASDDYTISFVTVPEPTTILLFVSGLIGIFRKSSKRV